MHVAAEVEFFWLSCCRGGPSGALFALLCFLEGEGPGNNNNDDDDDDDNNNNNNNSKHKGHHHSRHRQNHDNPDKRVALLARPLVIPNVAFFHPSCSGESFTGRKLMDLASHI